MPGHLSRVLSRNCKLYFENSIMQFCKHFRWCYQIWLSCVLLCLKKLANLLDREFCHWMVFKQVQKVWGKNYLFHNCQHSSNTGISYNTASLGGNRCTHKGIRYTISLISGMLIYREYK